MVKTRLAEASGKGFGATLVDDIPPDFLGRRWAKAPHNEHIVVVDSAFLDFRNIKNHRLSKSVFKLSNHSIPYLFNISSL